MPTAVEVRQAVDNRLANLWNAIQAKEAAYLAANGRYWQGLRTHSVAPADGATATPDVGTRTPTDQPDPWPAAVRNTGMEMALRIDTYDGPLGQGYQATVWVAIQGEVWGRTAQVGPETWRAAGWRRVTEGV